MCELRQTHYQFENGIQQMINSGQVSRVKMRTLDTQSFQSYVQSGTGEEKTGLISCSSATLMSGY